METTPEQHEVAVPEIKTGSIQFLTPAAFSNPAPARLTLICDIIRNFAGSMILLVSATTFFTGNQAKEINFALSAACLLCEAIKKATGVKPTTT